MTLANSRSFQNWIKQTLVALSVITVSACAAPAFDVEAWRSAKLAEIQSHPLETNQSIPVMTVKRSLFREPLEQQVAALAPDLSGRIVGARYSTVPFVGTHLVFFDEPPVLLAEGVCRALFHEFSGSADPSYDVAVQPFSARLTHVRFFAAEPSGSCPYHNDQRGFHASSDARAIFLIANARTLAANLRTKQMRIRCDESLPNCESVLSEAFDVSRIRSAGSCLIEPRCIALQFPYDGPAAPNGISVEIVPGSRSLTVAALAPPPPF